MKILHRQSKQFLETATMQVCVYLGALQYAFLTVTVGYSHSQKVFKPHKKLQFLSYNGTEKEIPETIYWSVERDKQKLQAGHQSPRA